MNVNALVGAFNQEKALVGAFSVIVKTGCGTDGSFYSTSFHFPKISNHPCVRGPAAWVGRLGRAETRHNS